MSTVGWSLTDTTSAQRSEVRSPRDGIWTPQQSNKCPKFRAEKNHDSHRRDRI